MSVLVGARPVTDCPVFTRNASANTDAEHSAQICRSVLLDDVDDPVVRGTDHERKNPGKMATGNDVVRHILMM